jgi:hypothetical protein
MHPLLCGAAPVTLCSASHVDTLFDVKTGDRRQAADVFTEHDIGPTNDTRRGVRAEVREARAGERRMGTALAFLGQWWVSWGQG